MAGKGGLYPTKVLRASALAHTIAAPEPVVEGRDPHRHRQAGARRLEHPHQTGDGGALKAPVTANTSGARRRYGAGDSGASGATAVVGGAVVE